MDLSDVINAIAITMALFIVVVALGGCTPIDAAANVALSL